MAHVRGRARSNLRRRAHHRRRRHHHPPRGRSARKPRPRDRGRRWRQRPARVHRLQRPQPARQRPPRQRYVRHGNLLAVADFYAMAVVSAFMYANAGEPVSETGLKVTGEAVAGIVGRAAVWVVVGPLGGVAPKVAYNHGYKYAHRMRARAVQDPVSHNFPYCFDDAILATKPQPKTNGYRVFQKRGTMTGSVKVDPKTGRGPGCRYSTRC